MPSSFSGSKSGPSSKAGMGMAKSTAARSSFAGGKQRAVDPPMRPNKPTLAGPAFARTKMMGKGRGIPADRGRTSGSTWTKKGMK